MSAEGSTGNVDQGQEEGENKMETEIAEVRLDYTPGPNAVDISLDKSGKLWKEVIREGRTDEGDLSACDGMEVKVHYIGTLTDGTEFDRSNRKAGAFSFVLGEGKVIKAWDIGVTGMKRGEVCKLICHPDLAYGKNPTGKIPANSTLIFEVEMLDYVPEDLTKNKNGHILRYKKKLGKSRYITPNYGSLVEVFFEGKCKDVIVVPGRTETFLLGEGSVVGIPHGVEKALYKFAEGEVSVLTISNKYGPPQSVYQSHGLPPDSSFQFTVELKSMENSREPWQMDALEKLVAAREYKEKGGRFFSEGSYRLACYNYKRIVDFLKAEASLEGEPEEERKSLMLASHLNQAICHLKLNKPVQAIRHCDDALDISHDNTKGLYRRGVARLAVNEPDAAKSDFHKVLEIEPNNKAAAQQIHLCDKKIKEHVQKEKVIYSKMFEKLGQMEKPKYEKPLPNGMDNVSEWGKPTSTEAGDSSEI